MTDVKTSLEQAIAEGKVTAKPVFLGLLGTIFPDLGGISNTVNNLQNTVNNLGNLGTAAPATSGPNLFGPVTGSATSNEEALRQQRREEQGGSAVPPTFEFLPNFLGNLGVGGGTGAGTGTGTITGNQTGTTNGANNMINNLLRSVNLPTLEEIQRNPAQALQQITGNTGNGGGNTTTTNTVPQNRLAPGNTGGNTITNNRAGNTNTNTNANGGGGFVNVVDPTAFKDSDKIAVTGRRFTGSNAGQYLEGDAKSQNITGGSGNDKIVGGGGNDVLNGGGGYNIITTGGEGQERDTVVHSLKGYGVDVVTDFDAASDKLRLTGGNYVELRFSDAVVYVPEGTKLTMLKNAKSIADLSSDDIDPNASGNNAVILKMANGRSMANLEGTRSTKPDSVALVFNGKELDLGNKNGGLINPGAETITLSDKAGENETDAQAFIDTQGDDLTVIDGAGNSTVEVAGVTWQTVFVKPGKAGADTGKDTFDLTEGNLDLTGGIGMDTLRAFASAPTGESVAKAVWRDFDKATDVLDLGGEKVVAVQLGNDLALLRGDQVIELKGGKAEDINSVWGNSEVVILSNTKKADLNATNLKATIVDNADVEFADEKGDAVTAKPVSFAFNVDALAAFGAEKTTETSVVSQELMRAVDTTLAAAA